MQKKLSLSLQTQTYEEGFAEVAARLQQLADASTLDLADEVGWELVADQCEESGEPEAVVHLALVTAWRVVLGRLHGLLAGHPQIMQVLGALKASATSPAALRKLEDLRKAVAEAQESCRDRPNMSSLLLRPALTTLDRAKSLHDRLKARGVLREK